MQAVMNAFETRGFPVAMTGEGARVMILEEPLAFGIEEGTKTVAHRVSYTEQRLIDRGLGYQVPKVDHVPSGQLSLVITNVRHVRQRWSEGSKPLEEMLNKFIIGLGRAARRASNDHRRLIVAVAKRFLYDAVDQRPHDNLVDQLREFWRTRRLLLDGFHSGTLWLHMETSPHSSRGGRAASGT